MELDTNKGSVALQPCLLQYFLKSIHWMQDEPKSCKQPRRPMVPAVPIKKSEARRHRIDVVRRRG